MPDPAISSGWAGIYPVTPDGLPIVGASSTDSSVFLATGAGGAGIMLSPTIGLLGANAVLGVESGVASADALEPARFDPARGHHV